MHERLFHLFVVSEGLDFFLHEHPLLGPDRRFRFRTPLSQTWNVSLAVRFLSEGRLSSIAGAYSTDPWDTRNVTPACAWQFESGSL